MWRRCPGLQRLEGQAKIFWRVGDAEDQAYLLPHRQHGQDRVLGHAAAEGQNCPTGPDQLQGLLQQPCHASGFDHDIRRPAQRGRQALGQSVTAGEQGACAHLGCQRFCTARTGNGDDPFGPQPVQPEYCTGADSPGADHCHPRARQRFELSNAAQGRGKGLDERTIVEGEAIRQSQCHALIDQRVLAEPTGHGAEFGAMQKLPLAACWAITTGGERQGRNSVANPQPAIRSGFNDFSGVFMAKRRTRRHVERTAAGHMQVGAADAAAADTDQCLASAWPRNGPFLKDERLPCPIEYCAQHRRFSLRADDLNRLPSRVIIYTICWHTKTPRKEAEEKNVTVTPALQRYEDVSTSWLNEALQGTWPGVKVAAVRRGAVFGHKQNKFRVEAVYDPSGTQPPVSQFIVKGNFPGENDPSTGSAWAMASEVRSIRDLAPQIAAPAMPDWYKITVEADAADILMEDLTPKGAVFFDAFRTLDLGHAMAFMDGFARMHASSWNSRALAAGGSMGPESVAGENRRMLHEMYFPGFFRPENWQSYVKRPRGRAIPRAFQDLSKAETAWHRMWDALRGSAMVVVHGDEHLGNLYVQADGTPGVIDWVGRPEHWVIGIVYFMLCSLDIIDRRRWERALISHYVTRLRAYGVTDAPNFDDAWFLYRCASFYPVVTWLNNSATWQPEAINTANVVRAAVAAVEHDAYGLLGI